MFCKNKIISKTNKIRVLKRVKKYFFKQKKEREKSRSLVFFDFGKININVLLIHLNKRPNLFVHRRWLCSVCLLYPKD